MPQNPSPVSIRDHMVSLAADGRPFFETVSALGVAAIELQVDPEFMTPHVRRPDGSPVSLRNSDDVAAFQEVLTDQGVHISALLLMTDFSAEGADDHVRWAAATVRLARDLSAPAVRIDPLTRNKELSSDKVRENFVRRVKQVLDATADTGVDLGIENHGPIGNDPAFLDAVFAAVNDPRLGMTLDTGNFYWWGVPLDELYSLIARYAPRTKHTHIKNINYPPELAHMRRPVGLDYGKYCCPLDEGNIDLSRIVRTLRDAGYRRDFCIENESLNKYPADQRLEILRRDVNAVTQALE
ncbi:MAG: Sugar phosphate isomerase/epimerase [Phycisphaerales bacterium]|nr:Sugar phosphate isomerase/epimerase [Phycisphaerales bacterium]